METAMASASVKPLGHPAAQLLPEHENKFLPVKVDCTTNLEGIGNEAEIEKDQVIGRVAGVQLKRSTNAWKATFADQKSDANDKEAMTRKLYSDVMRLLNKITPQTFDELSQEFYQVWQQRATTVDRIEGVIDILFRKVRDEPIFSPMYAKLCYGLKKYQLSKAEQMVEHGAVELYNFHFYMLRKCQHDFDKEETTEDYRKQLLAEIQKAPTEEEKKCLQDNMQESLKKFKWRTLGGIRFLGELYKVGLLTQFLAHVCVQRLIGRVTSTYDEETVECLCKLLTTIGEKLESEKADVKRKIGPETVAQYFTVLTRWQNDSRFCKRIKFQIQNLIELKDLKWVPRRCEVGPKTLGEIYLEAKLEQVNQRIEIYQLRYERRQKKQAGRESFHQRGPQRISQHDSKAQGNDGCSSEPGVNESLSGMLDRLYFDSTVVLSKASSESSKNGCGPTLLSSSATGATDGQSTSRLELSDDKLKKYAVELFEAYTASEDYGKTKKLVEEQRHRLPDMTAFILDSILRKRDKDRQNFAKLMACLLNERSIDKALLVDGFVKFVAICLDHGPEMDVPLLWDYLAQIVGEVITQAPSVCLADFLVVFRTADSYGYKFFTKTLKILTEWVDEQQRRTIFGNIFSPGSDSAFDTSDQSGLGNDLKHRDISSEPGPCGSMSEENVDRGSGRMTKSQSDPSRKQINTI